MSAYCASPIWRAVVSAHDDIRVMVVDDAAVVRA